MHRKGPEERRKATEKRVRDERVGHGKRDRGPRERVERGTGER